MMSHAYQLSRRARDLVTIGWLTACILAGVVTAVPATAQSATSPSAGTVQPAPEQVQSLLQLLSDPVVKSWIEREMQEASAPQAQTPRLAAAEASVSGFLEWRLHAWQEHLRSIAAALPGLSAEVGSAMGRMWEELTGRGLAETVLLLAVFIGLGLGVEWVFSWATARIRSRIESARPATAGERIRLVLARFLLELVRITVWPNISTSPLRRHTLPAPAVDRAARDEAFDLSWDFPAKSDRLPDGSTVVPSSPRADASAAQGNSYDGAGFSACGGPWC
jgi:hypothetical protein